MKPGFLPLFAALPLASISFTHAQSTFNTANDGGNWGTASNWTPATVPNAVDAQAIVNGAGPSNVAPATSALDVRLDGVYTIGTLTRTNAAAVAATFPTTAPDFDVTKGITFQKTTGTPEISVVGDVFFYSAIFGTQGFEKTGAGRFTFRFNPIDHTYTGPVKISGGVLGIQKDRSLGDVNNDIEITPTAAVDSVLFAEPSNNLDIVLPATRSITLNDADTLDLFDPTLRIDSTAFTFTVDGNIGEVASSGCFLKKTGGGVLVLNGTNSWTGGTLVTAGVLTATKPAALPNYETQGIGVTGTATLAVRYGDAWPWTDAEIGNLLGNSNLSFATGAAFGIDTTGNASAATLTGDIPAPNFSKIGPGTLVLDDSQTNIAGVSLFGGTLELGTAGGLPSGIVFKNLVGGSILNLGGTAASFSDLQEVSGGATTITNGSLTYTGATLTISGNSGTTVDLSGLTSFTYSAAGSELKLENANNVNASQNTTLFASGTNTITASSRVLVGGGSSNANGIHLNTARLGTTNTINTNTLQLGAFNSAGLINFQTGLTNPSLKVRAADGTSAIPTVRVGETSSGVRSGAGTLDLTGGSADISATAISVGRHIAGANNGETSTMTVPAGTVTAAALLLAEKANGGSPAMNSTFNQRGTAIVSIDSITMGQTSAPTNPASSVQFLFPTYNLEGGTLTTAEIKPGTFSTALAPQSQVETATAAGTITAAGTVSVTVTGAGIAGSPLVIPVAVANGDTAVAWAGKVATALQGTAAITALYTVTNPATTANIVLTRITPGVNDGTLNIALANGTATGVTAAPTSANTNANVVSNINRTVKLQGGTLINKAGGNLNISGPTPPLAAGNNPTTILIPGNTTAIVDSTAGQTVNFTDVTFSARINSATPSAGTLQVDGDVVLSSSGLTIFDDAPTNATLLSGGTKLVLIDYQYGSLTGTFSGLADGATVNVTKGTVTNEFVLDYNDPAYGGKAVTLTVPAGSGFGTWITGTFANGTVSGGQQGPKDDPDGDGIENLIEYAVAGLDPTQANGAVGTQTGLTITYPKRQPLAGDITYAIESSDDLGVSDAWAPAAGVTQDSNQISITLTNPGDNFARLKVTEN